MVIVENSKQISKKHKQEITQSFVKKN